MDKDTHKKKLTNVKVGWGTSERNSNIKFFKDR